MSNGEDELLAMGIPWLDTCENKDELLTKDRVCCPVCVCKDKKEPCEPLDQVPKKCPFCFERRYDNQGNDTYSWVGKANQPHTFMGHLCSEHRADYDPMTMMAIILQALGPTIGGVIAASDPRCYQYQWLTLLVWIGWILTYLYSKEVKIAYLIGIPMAAFAQIITFTVPWITGVPVWYANLISSAGRPIDFALLLLVGINFGIMYFSYKAYQAPPKLTRKIGHAALLLHFIDPKAYEYYIKERRKSAKTKD